MEKNAKPRFLPVNLVWIRPVSIIVAFSLLLGWFGGTVTKPYIERGYQPLWEEAADWISPKMPAATGYYRTKLMIDNLPIKASLQVAAPDHFDIYVNGKKVGGNSFTSIHTSGIYDIASLLEVGVNVIAIRVVKKTYSGSPLLIVNGFWQDSIGGGRRKIVSDTGSWRVAIKQESQAGGKLSWFDKDFADDQWERPVSYKLKAGEIIQDLTVPPDLYAYFPRGEWIWSRDTFALSGTFRRIFDLSGRRIESAWLGIATNGTYKLSVNDVVMLAGSPGNANMDTLNIGRYLKFGRNNITLDITSHQPGIRLAVSAKVTIDGVSIDLSSDQNWLSRSENTGAQETSGDWSDAFLLGLMEPVQISHEIKVKSGVLRGTPAIRMLKMDVPLATAFNEVFRFFWYMVGVLLANFCLGLFFMSYLEKWALTDKASALEIYAVPNFVGILLIAALVLVGFDLRINPLAIFNPITLLGVILIISGWIAWMMGEVYIKRARQKPQSGRLGGQFP